MALYQGSLRITKHASHNMWHLWKANWLTYWRTLHKHLNLVNTIPYKDATSACTTIQVASCQPLNAEARVRSQASPRGINSARSEYTRGFSASTSVLPCQCHQTAAPHQLMSPTLWLSWKMSTSLNDSTQYQHAIHQPSMRWVSGLCTEMRSWKSVQIYFYELLV